MVRSIKDAFTFVRHWVRDWRVFCGVLIGAAGTLIIFSPNIPTINNLYSDTFFRNLSVGMEQLTAFEVDPTNIKDYRQAERHLDKGQRGFKELLSLLENIEPRRMRNRTHISITDRRDNTYFTGTGQWLDVLNVIHLHDPKGKPEYVLITTESDLRARVATYRNNAIVGTGTGIVLLGMFWHYIWQVIVLIFPILDAGKRPASTKKAVVKPIEKEPLDMKLQYQYLTSQVQDRDNKIVQFISLYFTLAVAIIGGAFYLASQPSGQFKTAWAKPINYLLILVSATMFLSIFNCLRSWKSYRTELFNLYEGVPEPGGLWWCISEASILLLMLIVCTGFWFWNPIYFGKL